jgi:hypothetical protein
MAQINRYRFTQKDDLLVAGHLSLRAGLSADALAGNDFLISARRGVFNAGLLQLAQGNDRLEGTSRVEVADERMLGIDNHGKIRFGEGDDTLIGDAFTRVSSRFAAGIYSEESSLIATGNGRARIFGTGRGNGNRVDGIHGLAVIRTGPDDDKILGTAEPFDPGSNAAGIYLFGGLTQMRSGNDRIEGRTSGKGIRLWALTVHGGATVSTGRDRDAVVGISRINHVAPEAINGLGNIGVGIHIDEATIKTGRSGDLVSGTTHGHASRAYGIQMLGLVDTGKGNDEVRGTAINETLGSNVTIGLFNYDGGLILADAGSDVVHGLARSNGENVIGIQNQGLIDLGEGDDRIEGFASATKEGPVYGIANDTKAEANGSGEIRMGNGNDSLRGEVIGSGKEVAAVLNRGLIDMGEGDDIIDGLKGGFSGDGLTRLGMGDDTLIGFGSGFFDAGGGVELDVQKDRLLLSDGVYTIGTTSDQDGYFDLMSDGIVMKIQGFELVGSASAPDDAIAFLLTSSAVDQNLVTIDGSSISIIAVK